MDQTEAERLEKAIGMMHQDWIEVLGVEYESQSGTYQVRCAYREQHQKPAPGRDVWKPLLIRNPRQWITLLTQQNGGLEQL